MNLEGIKLYQLRSLVTVANLNNFSEAALSMGISQSAVSHAIASLEEQLGVVLLSRGRHGATLTPVGERIVEYAQQILMMVEGIGREATLSKGLEGGHVRVVSFRSAATHVLPKVIAQFRQQFPGITVNLSDQRGDDKVEQILREGRADIGLICLPPPPDFEVYDLMQDEYVALLPPDAIVPEPLTWETLASFPLILPAPSDHCAIIIRRHLMKVGQMLPVAYEIQEDSTIVSMVMQGLGATIMARLAGEPLPPAIQAFSLPVPLYRTIYAVMVANALHTPATYAFLEALKTVKRSPLMAPTPISRKTARNA